MLSVTNWLIAFVLGGVVLVSPPLIQASGGGWEVATQNDEEVIKNPDLKTPEYTLTGVNGMTPRVREVIQKKAYDLIVYEQGEAGTSQNILIVHAVVYDKLKSRFLGEFPWEFLHPEATPPKRAKVVQPIWKLEEDRIIYSFASDGVEKNIEFRPPREK